MIRIVIPMHRLLACRNRNPATRLGTLWRIDWHEMLQSRVPEILLSFCSCRLMRSTHLPSSRARLSDGRRPPHVLWLHAGSWLAKHHPAPSIWRPVSRAGSVCYR